MLICASLHRYLYLCLPISHTGSVDPYKVYEQDEKAFYEALLSGSSYAHECLYKLMHNQFIPIACQKGGEYDEALDVLHDCIAIFLYKLRSGEYVFREGTKITTYLHAICIRQWYTYVNKRKKRSETSFEENLNPDNDDTEDKPKRLSSAENEADDQTDEDEKTAWAMRLKKAMSFLTEDCQTMLYSFYVEELSLREIAKLLEITEKSAEVKRFRCAKYLRDKFKGLS